MLCSGARQPSFLRRAGIYTACRAELLSQVMVSWRLSLRIFRKARRAVGRGKYGEDGRRQCIPSCPPGASPVCLGEVNFGTYLPSRRKEQRAIVRKRERNMIVDVGCSSFAFINFIVILFSSFNIVARRSFSLSLYCSRNDPSGATIFSCTLLLRRRLARRGGLNIPIAATPFSSHGGYSPSPQE